jgi:A/G-specific adenine glycosylase
VARAESYLPRSGRKAARWAVSSMELGALVCTARSPRCGDCPVRRRCRWLLRGRPVHDGPPRRGQSYAGTDRQCRGALLAVLRSSDGPVPPLELSQAWPDAAQRSRCLGSLEADGLLVRHADDYSLPH